MIVLLTSTVGIELVSAKRGSVRETRTHRSDLGPIKTVDCDDSADGDEAVVNVKMHLKAGSHCEAVNGGLSAKWRGSTPPSRLTPVSSISWVHLENLKLRSTLGLTCTHSRYGSGQKVFRKKAPQRWPE